MGNKIRNTSWTYMKRNYTFAEMRWRKANDTVFNTLFYLVAASAQQKHSTYIDISFTPCVDFWVFTYYIIIFFVDQWKREAETRGNMMVEIKWKKQHINVLCAKKKRNGVTDLIWIHAEIKYKNDCSLVSVNLAFDIFSHRAEKLN